jgi:uncharacterized protein YecE (DUF72 family)
MGDKLRAILFQLPPYMRADIEQLQKFQALLPDSLPTAFEFRHDSWLDADVDRALQARGHARVVSHDGTAPAESICKNRLVYLRLGASNYTDAGLNKWHAKVVASGAENAFVFFKHEDDGAGPAMAVRSPAMADGAKLPRQGAKMAAKMAVSKPARKPAGKATASEGEPARAKPARAAGRASTDAKTTKASKPKTA